MAQKALSSESPGPDATRSVDVSRRPRLRALAAGIGGLLMAAAFPPVGIWPLAPVGVAVFTLAVRGRAWRAGASLGLICGLVFFLLLGEWERAVGLDAWIALSIFEALYYLPLGAGVALVTRLPGWPLWSAGLWVAQEFVRGRVPLGGLPWGRLAFSQTSSPLSWYAAVGSAPLLTFMVTLMGGFLAAAALAAWRAWRMEASRAGRWRAGTWRARRAELTVVVAAVAGAVIVGAGGLVVPRGSGGDPVTVAVVQGNVPRLGLDFLGQRKAVLNNHARQTHLLAARIRAGEVPKPDLVVWPENSSDIDPYTDADARETIDAAVRDVGVPTLVGAVIVAPDGANLQNRGIVWDPRSGPGDYYVKRHPVPFGEYLPLRGVLAPLISRFDRIPLDFTTDADRPGLLQLGPVRIGDVICFEVMYDGLVRDVAGAGLLVVQTNNATYGRTGLPAQQVAISRLRAVEHDRTVLVAATSGISAIIGPDGKMIEKSPEFTPDIQVRRVHARSSRTLADHLGAGPEWVLAILGVTATGAAWYGRKTTRRTTQNTTTRNTTG